MRWIVSMRCSQNIGTREGRHEAVARVDAAFDFAVDKPAFRTKHFVSDARKDGRWRGSSSRNRFSSARMRSFAELMTRSPKSSSKAARTGCLIRGRREQVSARRFQIRSERLKEAGIASIAQLRAYLPGLVRHLATQHTSLRIPTRDKNRSRWPRHPMWNGLIAAADELVEAREYRRRH